jgi:mRNA interferase MazF
LSSDISCKGLAFEVTLPEGVGVNGVVLADLLKSLDWRLRTAKLIAPAFDEILEMVISRILPWIVAKNAATL